LPNGTTEIELIANPLLGVVLHWIGGLSSASFYVPYKGVRRWSWEIFWLTGGVFSWLIGPWFFAALQTRDLLGVLGATPHSTLFWCYVFGLLWGLGGLTFGLTMRYLGLSLGMAVALGFTTAFGTMVPPIFAGEFTQKLLQPIGGRIVLAGILVTLIGIALVALAGRRKETELSPEEQKLSIGEFNYRKGLAVATFSGILSSCFAYGVAAGAPIRALGAEAGTGSLWQGLPVLCVVLAGGFTTNCLWCLALIIKNRSGGEWVGRSAGTAGLPAGPLPLARNYLLCTVGGLLWYFQFFFYTMGESQMGRYGFSSWTLHMASIIIFATLWGFALKEWSSASHRTRRLVWAGIATLVGATIIIGYGNSLAR
jgi:L-rhamnose-H+ transport protein